MSAGLRGASRRAEGRGGRARGWGGASRVGLRHPLCGAEGPPLWGGRRGQSVGLRRSLLCGGESSLCGWGTPSVGQGVGLRGCLLCMCVWILHCGAEETPPPPPPLCVWAGGEQGEGRWSPPTPPCWGGEGRVWGWGRPTCWGRRGQGAWGGEGPAGKELRTLVVLGIKASCSLLFPPLPKRRLFSLPPSFPLAGTGSEEAKGVEKGEPRASIWRAACLGRESGGGNASRSGAKAGGGLCLWLVVLRLEIEMFPAWGFVNGETSAKEEGKGEEGARKERKPALFYPL